MRIQILAVPMILKIPADHPTRRQELEQKLENYRQRLEGDRGTPYEWDTSIKLLVLQTLLMAEHGEVHIIDILKALPSIDLTLAEQIQANMFLFFNACSVINSYCHGVANSDGTSLPGLN